MLLKNSYLSPLRLKMSHEGTVRHSLDARALLSVPALGLQEPAGTSSPEGWFCTVQSVVCEASPGSVMALLHGALQLHSGVAKLS